METKKGKLILAIETSVGQGSVSLLLNGEVKAFRLGASQATRSTDVLPDIQHLFSQTGYEKDEFDLIAVSTGPGSLTGARVGIAVAKGLALAMNRKCVGVSALESLAFVSGSESKTEGEIAAVIAAGRTGFYFQYFSFSAGEKKSESKIFIGNTEQLSASIKRIRPVIIVAEPNAYLQIKENIKSEKNIIVICASDNVSEYIGRLSELKGKSMQENSLATKAGSIEPIYVSAGIIEKEKK